MTFFEAIQTVWSKYATFSGRASRPEFWWWMLFVVLLSIPIGIVDGALTGVGAYAAIVEWSDGPLSIITNLVLFLPGFSVSVRRLHDIDRSGWWVLILTIFPIIAIIINPIIGVISLVVSGIVFIYWGVKPGTKGSNNYGAPPSAISPDA